MVHKTVLLPFKTHWII